MKQIFDWMRGAILDKAFEGYNGQTLVDIHDVGNIINEAEAKWEAGHKSYDVEKVVECIHEYFVQKIDDCEEDIVPHEILEYNKAICEIVRKGKVE